MTKTVLIATSYFPPHPGGVEQYVRNVGGVLHSRHGWRVVIVTSAEEGEPSVSREGDFVVYRLPYRLRLSNTPIGLLWLRELRRIIRLERVDVVNAHAPVPYMAEVAALAAGKRPFVLTYHAGPVRGRPLWRWVFMKSYEKFALPLIARRSRAVICSSEYVAGAFARHFGDKVWTVPPGVDVERFTFDSNIPQNRILFVGALDKAAEYKGVPTLLKAFALLKQRCSAAQLEIVGDGTARADFEQMAVQLGLEDSVVFRGRLAGDELVQAYRSTTVTTLPSEYDSFPTVLAESMSVGRPVVATLVGGIPTMVTNGVEGILIHPRDPETLARELAKLLENPELTTRLGRAGRDRVENTMSHASRAEETNQILRSVVSDDLSDARSNSDVGRRAAVKAIAVVTPYFWPKIGGVERCAYEVAEMLAETPGFEPVVITSNMHGRDNVVEEVNGYTVYRLGAWFRFSNTPINPMWLWQVPHIMRKHRVEAFVAHSPVPFLADVAVFAKGRRKAILTYHSGSMLKGKSRAVDALLRVYERVLLPKLFSHSDEVVAVSPVSLAHDVAGSVMISPGVDVDEFVPLPAGEVKKQLLYVGRMDRSSAWKGVDVLIRAFAEFADSIPEVRLRLVGEGDSTDDLRSLAQDLGIGDRVDFTGGARGAELVQAFAESTATVLPSLTESESFGRVLIESMACGRPAIGSDVGGIPHVIADGETGLLIPPGDVSALAEACRKLLLDPELADRLGRNGRDHVVKQYSVQTERKKFLQLIRRQLGMEHRQDVLSEDL